MTGLGTSVSSVPNRSLVTEVTSGSHPYVELQTLAECLHDAFGVTVDRVPAQHRLSVLNERAERFSLTPDAYLKRYADHRPEMAALWRLVVGEAARTLPRVERVRQWIEHLEVGGPWRGWVAGFEPAGEAIMLALEMARRQGLSGFTLFATALDEEVIAEAGTRGLPPEVVEALGDTEDLLLDGRPAPALRARMAYAVHDLFRTPPFSRLDFLHLEQVSPWLNPEVMRQVLARCAYALNPGGLLLLDPRVSNELLQGRFEPVEGEAGLFRRAPGDRVRSALLPIGSTPARGTSVDAARRLALSALIEREAVGAWVVDAAGRVELTLKGWVPAHEPKRTVSADRLRTRVPPEVGTGLMRALDEASESGGSVRRSGMEAAPGRTVDLEVGPLLGSELFLVVFREVQPSAERNEALEAELIEARERLERIYGELQSRVHALDYENGTLQKRNRELIDAKAHLESELQELRLEQVRLREKLEQTSDLAVEVASPLECAGVPAVFLSESGTVVGFTSHLERLVGQSPPLGEPLASSLFGTTHSLVEARRAGSDTEEAQVRLGTRPALARCRPMETEDGAPCGLVVAFTDLSRVLEETDARQLRERQLADLLEDADDPTIEVSPGGRIRFANRAARALLGIGHEDERSLGLVLAGTGGDSAKAMEMIEAARHGLERPRIQLRLGPSGALFDLTARPIYTRGEVVSVVVSARDMTELLEFQRQLAASRALMQSAMDSLDSAVAVAEASGRIRMHNDAWARSTARSFPGTRARQGDPLLDILADEHLQGSEGAGVLHQHLNLVLEGEDTPPSVQFAVRGGTGLVHLEVRGVPIRHGGERLLLVTMADVTRLKEAEEQRLAVQAKILDADKLESLGVLAGGVAHDFNNLLVGILSNASFVLDQVEPGSSLQDSLRDVEIAAERAAQLCQQLLAFSGRGRFQIRELRLDELVRNCGRLLMSGLPKSTQLVADLSFEGEAPTVDADATQMRQVLFNLVSNGAEALDGRPGRVVVQVGVTQLNSEQVARMKHGARTTPGRFAFLRVKDDGGGISEEIREKVFEPFFTTKFTGRGLGLAAVQGIVQGHGGAIDVVSRLGQGTTMTVYFPLKGTRKATETPLVLVVDDEKMVRAASTRALGRAGFTVEGVESGERALEFVAERGDEVSLVLLDVTMPGMSGEDTYVELRRVGFGAPILFSSGLPELSSTSFLIGDDRAHFIQKPYRSSVLVERVRTILEP